MSPLVERRCWLAVERIRATTGDSIGRCTTRHISRSPFVIVKESRGDTTSVAVAVSHENLAYVLARIGKIDAINKRRDREDGPTNGWRFEHGHEDGYAGA